MLSVIVVEVGILVLQVTLRSILAMLEVSIETAMPSLVIAWKLLL